MFATDDILTLCKTPLNGFIKMLTMSRISLFLLFIILSAPASADNALQYLNTLRQQAGMLLLKQESHLTTSATKHALYLARNKQGKIRSFYDAHIQNRNAPLFIGNNVSDRAKRMSYPHSVVSENISVGNSNVRDAIDLLMSGIYHRFGFLDFSIDEIGVGIKQSNYVFNMGRNDISRTCTNPGRNALSTQGYDCAGIPVTEQYWNKICKAIPQYARYEKPYDLKCANGNLLKQSYMTNFCRNPPESALFKGVGRFYELCDGRYQVDAHWFDQACHNDAARYQWDGNYYQVCQNKTRVHSEWFEERCQSSARHQRYTESGEFYDFCASKKKIRAEYYRKLNQQKYKKNPYYVVWPANNAQRVMTTFLEEFPDPLPDMSVSGYPLSLQFNPGLVNRISIKKFQLFRHHGGEKQSVNEVRFMHSKNDPNKKFTALQFAWFPLKPLAIRTRYSVNIEAVVDGQLKKITWHFKTGNGKNYGSDVIPAKYRGE
ncbi:MAG: Unknown protein [uncultured Thiotrichaceae bacterium]|uniref:SCP domain-containing protein n=1 Tax=uncultured Thiotrichaceae bacterium TaxID=298394 RepID=A0A6S6SUS0_9GAMM|nr:MAG: Unknown protein [uncultured Thiotrichaceae bacterium]